MDGFFLYIKESYNELVHNVTWPSWSDLLVNARLVIIATIIFALVVFAMDSISKSGLDIIYGLGS